MEAPTLGALYVIVGALFVAGLAGAILPFLPGTPLIFAGALVYAFATHWSPVGAGRLGILAGLAALSFVLGHIAGALGARRFGGSRWAIVGALAGALIGIAFGPLGLLLGPLLGAVAGELLRGADVEHSIRSGVGALLGMLAGVVANLALSITMIGLFVWWVWRE